MTGFGASEVRSIFRLGSVCAVGSGSRAVDELDRPRMAARGGEPPLAKDVATAWTALKRPFAARSNQVCPRRNGTTRGSTRSLRWKAPAWLRPGSEKKWPSGMRRLADFACSQAGSASPL
jgi:hypothetical protein